MKIYEQFRLIIWKLRQNINSLRDTATKLTKDENNLSSLASIKEIEFVVKNLPTHKKIPDPNGFPGEFCQIFKKEVRNINPIQSLAGNWRGGMLPNLFYESSIILTTNSDKNIIKK